MADPLVNDDPQAQWGLKPQPPPFNISEDQRWGGTALPGQARTYVPEGVNPADVPQDVRGGQAFDTGPAPVPQGPMTQQAVDDARELDLARQEEIKAYSGWNERTRKNDKPPLSVVDFSELPPSVTREQHRDWNRYQTALQMLAGVPPGKEKNDLAKQVDAIGKRIDADTKATNTARAQTRREQLARDDAPYQSVEARGKTASQMETYIAETFSSPYLDVNSRDAATARQADYNRAVSPITTMSKPKVGTDPNAKPDATNRDYTPLREAATDLATHNRHLTDGGAAMRYALKIGTPGGGTDEKGNQIRGVNGRYGMGATNYQVVRRDEMGNVVVRMDDGQMLRVPPQTFRNLMIARQQGAQLARKWEEDYKKSQEPGWVRRGAEWVLKSVIPEKGF